MLLIIKENYFKFTNSRNYSEMKRFLKIVLFVVEHPLSRYKPFQTHSLYNLWQLTGFFFNNVSFLHLEAERRLAAKINKLFFETVNEKKAPHPYHWL